MHGVLAGADYPPTVVAAAEETSAVAPASATNTTGSRRHRVGAGETLWSIAHHYGITVEQLRRWNKLDRKKSLQRGRVLIVAAR
jgi:LysM repeat protein